MIFYAKKPFALIWDLSLCSALPWTANILDHLEISWFGPFLANDVTLVTSYGYCQSLKINDIRVMLSVIPVLQFVRLGGYSVRWWVGCAPGHWNSYLISSTNPYSQCYGSKTPRLWSVLHSPVWIYFECLFCVCEVWQDFIRLAEVQISTAASTRWSANLRCCMNRAWKLTLLRSLVNSERNNI